MHTFSKFSNDEIILQLKGFLPGMAEILLNLALNTNQSINQSINQSLPGA
jgi:hypothetical protein